MSKTWNDNQSNLIVTITVITNEFVDFIFMVPRDSFHGFNNLMFITTIFPGFRRIRYNQDWLYSFDIQFNFYIRKHLKKESKGTGLNVDFVRNFFKIECVDSGSIYKPFFSSFCSNFSIEMIFLRKFKENLEIKIWSF